MSCAANAKETHGMKKSKLFISETYADQARRPRFLDAATRKSRGADASPRYFRART